MYIDDVQLYNMDASEVISPDLTISDITYTPQSNVEVGQQYTLTATIQNSGTAEISTPFTVDFRIDGQSIGTQQISSPISVNVTSQVSHVWTVTQPGTHTVEVFADNMNAVLELNEGNNGRTSTLPNINDHTAPSLTSTTPSNGTILGSLSQVSFTLNDQYTPIDDAAVIASVIVTNSQGQTIPGDGNEERQPVRLYSQFCIY